MTQLLAYLVVGQAIAIIVLAKMATLSARDRWIALLLVAAWPGALVLVAAHRVRGWIASGFVRAKKGEKR